MKTQKINDAADSGFEVYLPRACGQRMSTLALQVKDELGLSLPPVPGTLPMAYGISILIRALLILDS